MNNKPSEQKKQQPNPATTCNKWGLLMVGVALVGLGIFIGIVYNNLWNNQTIGEERPRQTEPVDILIDSSPTPAPVRATNTSPASAQASTHTFAPIADSYTNEEEPTVNHGKNRRLRTDAEPAVLSYLQFELDGLAPYVVSAKLHLFAYSNSGSGVSAYLVTENGWHETEINHDNAPMLGEMVGNGGDIAEESWVAVDIAATAIQEGMVTLAIVGNSRTNISYASREAGELSPYLVVETAFAPPPTPAPAIQMPNAGIQPLTFAVTPVADARTKADEPSKWLGDDDMLRIDGDPEKRAYLRFELPDIDGEITRLTLQLFAITDVEQGFDVYQVGSDWTEGTLTFENAPALGERLAIAPTAAADSWLEIDLTALAGERVINIGLATENESSMGFVSREGGAFAPQLFVEATVATNEVVLLAVGDIATCKRDGDERTSALVGKNAGMVALLGDIVYEKATFDEFAECYHPSWGQHTSRTIPAVGNHEYETRNAVPYYDYFGARAGEPDKGYFSLNYGDWHIVVLNTNCSRVGGCDVDSPQYKWLEADLAAHPTNCTIGIWHHPRYSSGTHGSFESTDDFWDLLYENGAEMVLVGHDHIYERFDLLDDTDNVDEEYGIQQFVVGLGGKSRRPIEDIQANSLLRYRETYGVLKLTLRPDEYDWEFLSVEADLVVDAGTLPCHPAPESGS
jgi:hypothetical protein